MAFIMSMLRTMSLSAFLVFTVPSQDDSSLIDNNQTDADAQLTLPNLPVLSYSVNRPGATASGLKLDDVLNISCEAYLGEEEMAVIVNRGKKGQEIYQTTSTGVVSWVMSAGPNSTRGDLTKMSVKIKIFPSDNQGMVFCVSNYQTKLGFDCSSKGAVCSNFSLTVKPTSTRGFQEPVVDFATVVKVAVFVVVLLPVLTFLINRRDQILGLCARRKKSKGSSGDDGPEAHKMVKSEPAAANHDGNSQVAGSELSQTHHQNNVRSSMAFPQGYLSPMRASHSLANSLERKLNAGTRSDMASSYATTAVTTSTTTNGTLDSWKAKLRSAQLLKRETLI